LHLIGYIFLFIRRLISSPSVSNLAIPLGMHHRIISIFYGVIIRFLNACRYGEGRFSIMMGFVINLSGFAGLGLSLRFTLLICWILCFSRLAFWLSVFGFSFRSSFLPLRVGIEKLYRKISAITYTLLYYSSSSCIMMSICYRAQQ